jgi:type III secretory pathway component EscV/Tfp pilus assembly protein PilF
MTETPDARRILDACRAAAERAGLTFDTARGGLDALDAAAARAADPFDLWVAVDDEVGRAETPEERRRLAEFRSHFVEELFAAEAKRTEEAFRRGGEAGWESWTATLAAALAAFRHLFAARWCGHGFPFTESQRESVEGWAEAVRRMHQARWPEAYRRLSALARTESLPALVRARLFVILAQIKMFHLVKLGRAKELLDEAERLAPADARVLSGVGNYRAEKNELGEARSYYERAIAADPALGNGYVGMGETFEKEGRFKEAESWYLKAVSAAPGDSSAYGRLVRLYGQPEFFAARRGELRALVERGAAASPEDHYNLYLSLAAAYEQNQEFDEAQRWFGAAIALDETRPLGHVLAGRCHETALRADEARRCYERAIEVAPECHDGYFNLGAFYEQRERWEEALRCYERAPQQGKGLAADMRAKVGEMRWRLGDYAGAEATLKRELGEDNRNETAKYALRLMITDYYKDRGERGEAVRLNDDLLSILGDSYAADYHNLLGNLHYFYDENDRAAGEYRLAAEADPRNATYQRNLAGAYRGMKDYARAEAHLRKAREIDGDEEAHRRDSALLLNAQGNDRYAQGDYRGAADFYEAATKLDPANEVFHSNLGGAWEQLSEPGRRQEALGRALEAYASARRIKPGGEYERAFERVARKKELLPLYGEDALDWVNVVTPITVEVAANLIPYTEGATPGTLSDELTGGLASLRARLLEEFGLKIPGVNFKGNESDLPEGGFVITIKEVPLILGNTPTDRRFFPGPPGELSDLGVEGEDAADPLTGRDGFWIGEKDWPRVEGAGLGLLTVMEYTLRQLEAVIRNNLPEFIGHQEVAALAGGESAAALEALRAAPEKLAALVSVCRALAAERAPLKPFAEIYALFERLYAERAGLQSIVEGARALPALRRALRGNDGRRPLLPLGPRFEAFVRDSIYRPDSHAVIAMEPELCRDALAVLRDAAGGREAAILVEDAELRPFVLFFELELPLLAVLSRRELRDDLEFETLPAAELGDAPPRPAPELSSRARAAAARRDGGDGLEARGGGEPREAGIVVSVNEEVISAPSGADELSLEGTLSLMQQGLFYELGVFVPRARVEIDSSLRPGEFRLRLNGRELPAYVGLARDEFFVNDAPDRLRLFGIEGRAAVNPANGGQGTIVRGPAELVAECRQAGLTTWGAAGFLVLTLASAIRKNAAAFQTPAVTAYMLNSQRAAFPELVDAALRRFPPDMIGRVLRELLDEEISIRDLRSILEGMLSLNGTTDVDVQRYIVFAPPAENLYPAADGRAVSELSASDYADFVRTTLKRYISHKHTGGAGTLVAYLLDREIEERIGSAGARGLTDEEQARLKSAVAAAASGLSPASQNPVILTSPDVRKDVRKLIREDFPNLPVLSYQELSPDLNIQPLARISWG